MRSQCEQLSWASYGCEVRRLAGSAVDKTSLWFDMPRRPGHALCGRCCGCLNRQFSLFSVSFGELFLSHCATRTLSKASLTNTRCTIRKLLLIDLSRLAIFSSSVVHVWECRLQNNHMCRSNSAYIWNVSHWCIRVPFPVFTLDRHRSALRSVSLCSVLVLRALRIIRPRCGWCVLPPASPSFMHTLLCTNRVECVGVRSGGS